ncbi:reprolysin-like metallopeptidase [Formosa sp. A9]|uniref:reprolysin-like metallopeptidase n=1 Tax=Formosa sp. A9 TaxID=3442641 RepID=UPI003EB8097B
MKNNNMLVRVFLVAMVTLFVQNIHAQNNYWTKSSETGLQSERTNRKTHPEIYQIFKLDLPAFKATLRNTPLASAKGVKTGTVVEFPMPDATFQKFSVTEAPIMQSKLAAKFPMIKTYKAVGIDDKTATMRFSVTPFGLHVFSLSGKRSSLFIDPFTTDGKQYMVYERASIQGDLQDFECLTDESVDLYSLKNDVSRVDAAYNTDKILRTYRLALSCNAKYGALFAGVGTGEEKKANIQAQMAITMNRVNEIYERDLAITLIFIDRNDELIYYNVNTDPWENEFNTKTQQVISTTLGDESLYDIGHNFNTSGGGSAGCLSCVCVDAVEPFTGSFSKGRGFTGTPNPVGDAFDIDYVAHEMGHQFGGYHTMNTCSRSGNGATEVEPASGSSIMGYAGICGDNNVQANTDAHFNYVNIRDINNNIQPQGNSSCGAQTPLDNVPPVANAGKDYSIPVSTPYVLTGTATDADGTETLTYNWSQNDPETAPAAGAPQSNWAVGPLYRSHLPTDSPSRYMPSLSDVVAGNLTPTWEVTPAVARTLNFAFTVRDNGSGFPVGIGQTHADVMTVTVVDGTPFTVANPNAATTWYVNTNYKVKWNVGETNKAPIDCKTVNIKLSTDGGYTYPITLASNVENNGEASVLIPDVTGTQCRIMVEAADNIFYDISNADFVIEKSEPMFLLEETNADNDYVTCQESESLTIDLDYTIVNEFNENTTFSVSNLPEGVTAAFAPETLATDGAIALTLAQFTKAPVGTHTITVTGTSASLTKTIDVDFTIKSSNLSAPALLTPANAATEVALNASLTWEASDFAELYHIEVSTVSDFSTDLRSFRTQSTNINVYNLSPVTLYYWRVKAINPCTESEFSSAYSFTSKFCSNCESTGSTAFDYKTSTTRVVFGSIDQVSGKTAFSDFTNISTNVNRGQSYELTVQVNTAGNYTTYTTVWIDWNYNCMFDENEAYDLGTAVNVSDGPTLNSGLSITVPEDAALTDKIIMRVSTKYKAKAGSCEKGYDGEVEDYTIHVLPTLGVSEVSFNDFKVWPNPNAGTFNVALTADSGNALHLNVYDLSGRRVFSQSYNNVHTFSETIALKNVVSGMYLLEVKDGKRSAIKKIIVE